MTVPLSMTGFSCLSLPVPTFVCHHQVTQWCRRTLPSAAMVSRRALWPPWTAFCSQELLHLLWDFANRCPSLPFPVDEYFTHLSATNCEPSYFCCLRRLIGKQSHSLLSHGGGVADWLSHASDTLTRPSHSSLYSAPRRIFLALR